MSQTSLINNPINSHVLSFLAELGKGSGKFAHKQDVDAVVTLAQAAFSKAPEDFIESISEG